MELADIAARLYGLPPAGFTAERDRSATEATRAGNRALAESLKQLRRPTTSAWLLNLLAREQPATVQQIVELGAALRQAQAQRVADELRRLSAERSRMVTAALDEIRRIARERGQAVSDVTAKEVRATLEAAVADPGAAEAVRSGLLTTALSYSGFGNVAVEPAVAFRSRRPAEAGKPAAAKAAREESRVAERDLAERRRRVSEVTERVEGLQRQLAALDEHRDRIRREAAGAAAALRAARKDLEAATRRLKRAE